MSAHRPRLLAAVLAVGLLLAACADDPVEAEPVPSPSPVPAPSPSPSPTGPFAPLTGELVDADAATRPALVVKIENTAKARPQAGLEDADIVIEELVEGGITRFFAVFQSTVPVQVGPVRSARTVDAALLPAFDGILLYSGGRDEVQSALQGTAVAVTEGDDGVYRQSGRSAPSNLFADGADVYAFALGEAPDLVAPQPWFTFDEEVPAGARTCSEVTCDGEQLDVTMSSSSTSGWTYDAAAGVYRRDQNGEVQTTVSGDPVGAANVVVLATETVESGCCDTAGSPYVTTVTTGQGRAIVLRDGQWYDATWSRASESAPFELAVDGVALPLRPGPTWIHLAPASRVP